MGQPGRQGDDTVTSYSQFQEDSWILKHLPLPAKGTFIEVGAYDGIASSNTYGFEREGWTGICVEPDPEIAARCRNNRTCQVVNAAISSFPGYVWFNINPSDRGASGLKRPPLGDCILVRAERLSNLIAGLNSEVDILSIDTEGTELDAWSTVGIYRPRIVVIEFWSQPNPPAPDPVVDQFTRDGYREVHRTTANLIFLKG